jgi:hypothetical protein
MVLQQTGTVTSIGDTTYTIYKDSITGKSVLGHVVRTTTNPNPSIQEQIGKLTGQNVPQDNSQPNQQNLKNNNTLFITQTQPRLPGWGVVAPGYTIKQQNNNLIPVKQSTQTPNQTQTKNLTPIEAVKYEAQTGEAYTPKIDSTPKGLINYSNWYSEYSKIKLELKEDVTFQKFNLDKQQLQSTYSELEKLNESISTNYLGIPYNPESEKFKQVISKNYSKENILKIQEYNKKVIDFQKQQEALNKQIKLSNAANFPETAPSMLNLKTESPKFINMDTKKSTNLIIPGERLDLVNLVRGTGETIGQVGIDIGTTLKETIIDESALLGIEAKKKALELTKGDVLKANLALPAVGLGLVGYKTIEGIGETIKNPNRAFASIVESALKTPTKFAVRLGIGILATKGVGIILKSGISTFSKALIGKSTTIVGAVEGQYKLREDIPGFNKQKVLNKLSKANVELNAYTGSKFEINKIKGTVYNGVEIKLSPQADELTLIHERVHRALFFIPEKEWLSKLDIAQKEHAALLGKFAGTSKDLFTTKLIKYPNPRPEILSYFAESHVNELLNPTTQTGAYLKHLLDLEAKTFGTPSILEVRSAGIFSSGSSTIENLANVGKETINLIKVKGLLKTTTTTKGIGLLNKNKIYSVVKEVQPIKGTFSISLENIPTRLDTPNIVSSNIKFAESKKGIITASSPKSLETLENMLNKEISHMKGKLRIGTKTIPVNETNLISPGSTKVVNIAELILPENKVFTINLSKSISKQLGVDVSRSFVKLKSFDLTTLENNPIRISGKTISSIAGIKENIPIKVNLLGKYYFDKTKVIQPMHEYNPAHKPILIEKGISPINTGVFSPVKNLSSFTPIKNLPNSYAQVAVIEKPVLTSSILISAGSRSLKVKQIVSSGVIEKGITAVITKDISKSYSKVVPSPTIDLSLVTNPRFINPYLRKKTVVMTDYDITPVFNVGEIPNKTSYSLISESNIVLNQISIPNRIQVKTTPIVSTIVKPVVLIKQIMIQKTGLITIPKTSTAILTKQLTNTLTKTKIITKPIVNLTLNNITPITTIRTLKQDNNYPEPPNTLLVRNKKKKKYNVITRIKGKSKILAKNLPVGKAYNIGARFTKESIARSFTIRPSGYTFEPDIPLEIDTNVFRSPKVGGKVYKEGFTFVEKSKFALDTIREQKSLKLGKFIKKNRSFKFNPLRLNTSL